MNTQLSIVIAEAKDVFAVPTEAVSTRGERSFIQVQNEPGEEAQQIPVETGMETDTMTEIRSQQLREGMEVLTGSEFSGQTGGMDIPSEGGNRGDMPMGGGMNGGGGGMPGGMGGP